MSGSVYTFTAATVAGGQYDWNASSNWIDNGLAGINYPFGQTAAALITAGGPAYTVALNFNINSVGGLGALQINSASATLALGSNSLLLHDEVNFSGTTGSTGNPLQLLAGTITDAGGTLIADANNVAALGTITDDGAITGFGTIEGNFTGTGSVQASGGTLDLTNAITSTSVGFDVGAAGSVLKLDSSVAAGVNVNFGSATGVIEIRNLGAFAAIINGLAEGTGTTPTANYVDVNATVTNATLSGNDIILSNGGSPIGTLALGASPPGGSFVDWKPDATLGGTDIFLSSTFVCYGEGTQILTDVGEIPVERIIEGTRVITLQGGEQIPQPVVWVGRMRVLLARHKHPEAAAPVRIRRHALADNVPHRDLLVSPEHCLFIDGKLFVARSLLNGTTIVQDMSLPEVTYYHIETARHAIVLAEGLAAETYLDTGNRAYFQNSGVALMLHPEFHVNVGLRCWEEDACAPLAITPTEREPVWRRLMARAEDLGLTAPPATSTADPDLRLAVGEATLRPVVAGPDRWVFVVPRAADTLRLVSRASPPTELRPWIEDQRRLGVCVARIVLRAADAETEIAADNPAFGSGWWAIEGAGATLCRWTDGDAMIALPPATFPLVVEVHLRHKTEYVLDRAGPDRGVLLAA